MMHTNTFFSAEELKMIRGEAARAESLRKLSTPVLNLIYGKGWLKVLEPVTCNGLEWELPRVVRLFEALAYADGNVGWCVNLGAGANMFSGYFEEQTARAIFSDSRTWCAGSGAVSGKAYQTDAGYWLSGRWKYASGSAHATHFTANACLFDKNQNPVMENGKPAFRSFIVPAAKVKVDDTWQVTGLKATSSNEFEADHVFVPEREVFSLIRPSPFASAPVFHFPFDVMAVVNMASMPLGMGLHFLELFEELMARKKPLNSPDLLGENERVKAAFLTYKSQLEAGRSRMYKALDSVWESYNQGATGTVEDLNHLKEAAVDAAHAARDAVYGLLPMCGMDAVFENSEINKVWRDISVAGQHYLLV